jgi:hypothetical protein
MMKPDLVYSIDNVWAGDDADAYGQESDYDPDRDVPEND